jgi:predicted dehydrogenase
MNKKIGLMGCGEVANYGHIPAILKTPGLELHSIYDPNPVTLKKTQERYGIANADTETAPFFSSGLDAVTITSPAPVHHQNVLDAAQHRLHVLCEKPLATNRAEAEEMLAAMQQAQASLYTAFCYRFSDAALKIRERVRGGAIGEVRSLRLIYNWDLHGKFATDESGEPVIQQRRHLRMLEGGPMVDCGTHQIDLAQFWLGSEVVRFTSHGAWVEDYEAPDHMWLHLDHANGAHTAIEISYSYGHTLKRHLSHFLYELIGTLGVIRYDREAKSFTMENAGGLTTLEFQPEKSFSGLYTEWSRALASGHSELLTSAEEGMRVVEIARQSTDQVIQSRRTVTAQ